MSSCPPWGSFGEEEDCHPAKGRLLGEGNCAGNALLCQRQSPTVRGQAGVDANAAELNSYSTGNPSISQRTREAGRKFCTQPTQWAQRQKSEKNFQPMKKEVRNTISVQTFTELCLEPAVTLLSPGVYCERDLVLTPAGPLEH